MGKSGWTISVAISTNQMEECGLLSRALPSANYRKKNESSLKIDFNSHFLTRNFGLYKTG